MSEAPIILWFRRDLRTVDHPALTHAVATGRPVIPVFIADDIVASWGAAARWRLGQALRSFGVQLEHAGAQLVLRQGGALEVLETLLQQTGAASVYWTRAYTVDEMERDAKVKSALRARGHEARSFGGHLLFEPWQVETKAGGPFRVYSPYWRAVAQRALPEPLANISKITAPQSWPESVSLETLRLADDMHRGAAVLADYVIPGQAAAQARLEAFLQGPINRYVDDRNRTDIAGTSGLSEYLAWGEISPLICWHAGQAAALSGAPGAEHFCKELVWREFAYHLVHHFPELIDGNWKPEWASFPWRNADADKDILAWKQGRTGIPFVDAAMRELYVTGTMHNRARMVAASFLTKHLLIDWRVGKRWFEECLIDWDPASNAMGWQWVAGSGPDGAPYFRIFNPVTQQQKFDPKGFYLTQWLAEGQKRAHGDAMRFYDAIPKSWNMSPDQRPAAPIISLSAGRARALTAYEELKRVKKR